MVIQDQNAVAEKHQFRLFVVILLTVSICNVDKRDPRVGIFLFGTLCLPLLS